MLLLSKELFDCGHLSVDRIGGEETGYITWKYNKPV